jgi:peptidoglycan/LPS O-acetylase OafA/YrhL
MQRRHPASSRFRDDINGLRAWAVASVVLYHFGIPGFAGGFAGVDVFFVISGFLMTGIALRGLEQSSFSLIGFYLARARRIWPALIALCAVLLLLGWFVLLPSEYRPLATHVLASLAFISNSQYLGEAGYFDAASHEKWLLHTWSLSVEWQFYLLLPLLMLILWRIKPGRRTQGVALLVVFIVSLGLSIWETQIAPSRAFYLLHTRAWELVAGGLCLFLPTMQSLAWRRRLETAGMLMIIVSVLGLDATTTWPGWPALLPVTGAMLVLMAHRQSPWTQLRIAHWLGTRSYSLYLWHWPAVVALFYLELQSDPLAIVLSMALVLALADASYRWIETPARGGKAGRTGTRIPIKRVVAFSSACAAALLIRQLDGLQDRFAPDVRAIAAQTQSMNARQRECHPNVGASSPSCVYGGPVRKAIVLGDSHGDAMVTAVAQAVPEMQHGIVQWTYSACPFLPGFAATSSTLRFVKPDWHCEGFRSWVLAQLREVPADVPIVLVNRYTELGESDATYASRSVLYKWLHENPQHRRRADVARLITEQACALAKTHPVYLVRPVPEYRVSVPQALARRTVWRTQHEQVMASRAQYTKDFAWVNAAIDEAQAQCGVMPLDPTPHLCDAQWCYGSQEDRAFYYDDDHLSEHGNKRLVPMFATVFAAAH